MSIIGNPIIVGKKPEQTKTVSPTTSQQIVTPDSGKVLSSVTVNAAPLQAKTVIPTKAGFSVSPDSGNYGLSSVKVNGDTNLVAGNIKSGVTIFGVTGTYNPVTSAIVIAGLDSTDTVTCVSGGTYYTATWDVTDQLWEIIGLSLGTYTITVTKSGYSYPKTVVIDIAGVYEIKISQFRLPDGFTELEYIQSTGTQYIQTTISAPNGFRISAQIMNNLASYSAICASRPTNTNVDNNGLFWEGSSQIVVAAGGWAAGGSRVTNKKYQVDASTIVGNLFFNLDNVSQSFSFSSMYPQTNQRSSNPLTLFAKIKEGGGIEGLAQDTLYSAKIYTSLDDSGLVGDFIPCKRNSDNTIGLFDLVSRQFFANAGTGSFIAGNPI